MKRRGRRPHPDILTPREWEVLDLIREGLSNEQIAERLEISVDGAKYHVSEILSKLGVRDRLEAARWSAEQRPWWAIALGPLGWWQRPLAAKLVAGALAVAIAAGGGLLVWGLLVTRGSSQEAGRAVSRTPTPPIEEVLLFDTASGTVKKVSDGHSLMLAKWVKDGETFTAYDTEARAWKLFNLNGKELRKLVALPTETAPYIVTHLYPSPDGKTAIVLHQTGSSLAPPVVQGLTVLDLVSGNETAFRGPPGENSTPLFSPDGRRLAYTNQNGPTVSLLVSDPDGSHANILQSWRSSDSPYLLSWSPDGSLLLVDSGQKVFEAIDRSGHVVWSFLGDRLTQLKWAGPGRVLADTPEVTTAGGYTRPATVRFERIADNTESTVPHVLEKADFIDVSPSGRYAVAGYGTVPNRRCSLINLDTGTEVAHKDETDVPLCGGYLSEWTADDRLALASFPGV